MMYGYLLIKSPPVICAECDFALIKGSYLFCERKKKICYSSKPHWCPIRYLSDEMIQQLTNEESGEV